MSKGLSKVFYNSYATPEVYAIIRAAAPPGMELLTLDSDSDEERRALLADAEVVIVASHPFRRPLIDAAPKLRLVHHQGVGWQDTLDAAALHERGIPIALTPEGTTVGVAEHTIMLMLAVLKRLPFADSELRAGRFHINALRPVSRELAGMTVGYIGMGRIAQAVAARLVPFGVSGLYHDPAVQLDAGEARRLGVTKQGFEVVLEKSDMVTLHVPLTPATRHLIGADALRRMRPGAFLINTSRGGLIDERALAAALESGTLAGAGLDVFETEPMPVNHPLSAFPNVVLTPHIAAGTRDALTTKMKALFANVERFACGEPLVNEVVQ